MNFQLLQFKYVCTSINVLSFKMMTTLWDQSFDKVIIVNKICMQKVKYIYAHVKSAWPCAPMMLCTADKIITKQSIAIASDHLRFPTRLIKIFN